MIKKTIEIFLRVYERVKFKILQKQFSNIEEIWKTGNHMVKEALPMKMGIYMTENGRRG